MSTVDNFKNDFEIINAPANEWFLIAPHNTNFLVQVPRMLYIGGAGNIVLVSRDGAQVTFTVTAGTILPVRPYKVLLTNTTAANIIGLV
jgi:hypothetical protein